MSTETIPMTDDELRKILLEAAGWGAFEDAFKLPGFARMRALSELAEGVAGVPIAFADVAAGGRFDTSPATEEQVWGPEGKKHLVGKDADGNVRSVHELDVPGQFGQHWPDGWSAEFFTRIFAAHQEPWIRKR